MDRPARASRGRVTEALERLRNRFGELPLVETDWPVSQNGYEKHRRRVQRGTLGGAGTWTTNDAGEVLLVREHGEWSEPAGKHEVGESLAETARRETREEVDVEVELTGVALVQRLRVRVRDDGADTDRDDDSPSTLRPATTSGGVASRPPIHRLIVTFDADLVAGQPRAADDGIQAVRWWDRHPERLRYEALRDVAIPAACD